MATRQQLRSLIAGTPCEHTEAQIIQLREMGNRGRAALMCRLSDKARRRAFRAIKRAHPEFSEQEVKLESVALNYGEDLARRVWESLAQQELENAGEE